MNPYDNNPFETAQKELRNEYDANRELAKTVANDVVETMREIFKPMEKDDLGFWK